MNKNPFEEIIETMRNEGKAYNPPSILIGKVISTPPNLHVQVAGVMLDKDNLLIADYLLPDYTRKANLAVTNAGVTNTVSSHSHSINLSFENKDIIFTDTFSEGDLLAIMPTQDRQTFIILCKVVAL